MLDNYTRMVIFVKMGDIPFLYGYQRWRFLGILLCGYMAKRLDGIWALVWLGFLCFWNASILVCPKILEKSVYLQKPLAQTQIETEEESEEVPKKTENDRLFVVYFLSIHHFLLVGF
ncbi:MAG: hypothetical protein CM15mP83_3850 [Flavobacteriaceae bacterium]|nr:MAG: hypothetical protein CM15mP83_3850 [Flavobacteriaceae bacterium]